MTKKKLKKKLKNWKAYSKYLEKEYEELNEALKHKCAKIPLKTAK